jgi:hypothetical protein
MPWAMIDQRYVQMTVERLRGPAHQHLSGEPLVTLRCAFVQFPPHLGQLALELHNLLLRIGADALLRVGLMRSPLLKILPAPIILRSARVPTGFSMLSTDGGIRPSA